jgi:hypothetical protein
MCKKSNFWCLSVCCSCVLTGKAQEEYIYAMAEQKKKQLKKKADKKNTTKVILSTDEDTAEEEELDEDEDAAGIYLEKEDVLVIYNALT